MALKEIKLPSGRTLSVAAAPFKDAKRLYQAVGGEFLHVEIGGEGQQFTELVKNVLCAGFSSLEIEKALEPCFARCLYEGVRIGDQTFEPESAREDYLDICVEVTKENIRPFTKSLFAQFRGLTGLVAKLLPSGSEMTLRGSFSTSDLKTPATTEAI